MYVCTPVVVCSANIDIFFAFLRAASFGLSCSERMLFVIDDVRTMYSLTECNVLVKADTTWHDDGDVVA